MAFELVKIFNQPIVEVENGSMMNENFKFTIKIETTYPLDHPLVFSFTYTDGRYEELLKSVSLPAPAPKKQRFATEVPPPNFKKAPLRNMLNGSAVLIDVMYNSYILSRIPIHMIVEDVQGELKPAEVEEESFIPEEEEFNEAELQALREAFGGSPDMDKNVIEKIRELAQSKHDAMKQDESNEKYDKKDKYVDNLPQFASEEQFARLKRDMIVLKNSVTDGQIKVQSKTVDE